MNNFREVNDDIIKEWFCRWFPDSYGMFRCIVKGEK